MVKEIQHFSQTEYNRVLDAHSAKTCQLSQAKCERILINHGASAMQAKNGAYVYIHHDGNRGSNMQGAKEEYTRLLDQFNAPNKKPKDCIRYLENLGFSYGQSKNAVYNYRIDRGLVKKR